MEMEGIKNLLQQNNVVNGIYSKKYDGKNKISFAA